MNRDNESMTILKSLARPIVTKSRTVKNPGALGGIFTFDFTVASSAPTVGPTFEVQGLVPGATSEKWHTIASVGTTDSTATGVRRIMVYPGASTADLSTVGIIEQENVSVPLPYEFRVTSTSASTGECTFSVGVDLIG